MATAYPIDLDMSHQPSRDARLYRLDPALGELSHVIVWTEAMQPHLQARAVALAATPWGSVKGPSLRPVAEYSHGWDPNHGGLLWLMGGYEIGPVEQPEIPDAPRLESTQDSTEGTDG